MLNTQLFDECLEQAKQEELQTFILNLLYDRPVETGDRSMIGLNDNYIYIDEMPDRLVIYDNTGAILLTIEEMTINDFTNALYVWQTDELTKLVQKLQIILDADKVIYIE